MSKNAEIRMCGLTQMVVGGAEDSGETNESSPNPLGPLEAALEPFQGSGTDRIAEHFSKNRSSGRVKFSKSQK